MEAGGDGFEAEEEAGEVVVGVDGAGFGEGEGCGVVAKGELDEGFGGDGALEVEMELGFGEAAEPSFGVGLFGLVGLGDLPGTCHRSSVANWGGRVVKGCWGGWLGFEGEVFDPVKLLGGIGDEHAAGLGDAAEGVVGGEAFAAEEGG